MQDAYVGDIGDYGKYGLLRAVTASGLRLAVNWYRVVPGKPSEQKAAKGSPVRRKQEDGKCISYLGELEQYRHYDPALFDCLADIVRKHRTIEAVEASGILTAQFFGKPLSGADRQQWHQAALAHTAKGEIVFLDPDNGLETASMHRRSSAKEKHVTWDEAKAYYERGQSVILYQHRPQRMKKARCIQGILDFQSFFLNADQVFLLEYPRYTNRFYFIFCHEVHLGKVEQVYLSVAQTWKGLCTPVDVCRLAGDP